MGAERSRQQDLVFSPYVGATFSNWESKTHRTSTEKSSPPVEQRSIMLIYITETTFYTHSIYCQDLSNTCKSAIRGRHGCDSIQIEVIEMT